MASVDTEKKVMAMIRSHTAWIQTRSGKQFWFANPDPESIDIFDIAHALSNQCRFNGHSERFYSVAEHSVLVSQACTTHPLWGLLHDAAEAYLGDMSSPIKHFPGMGTFRDIEEHLMYAITKKFNLCWPMPEEVRIADQRLLATEKGNLMRETPAPWVWIENVQPLDLPIHAFGAAAAREKFLKRFDELTKGSTV